MLSFDNATSGYLHGLRKCGEHTFTFVRGNSKIVKEKKKKEALSNTIKLFAFDRSMQILNTKKIFATLKMLHNKNYLKNTKLFVKRQLRISEDDDYCRRQFR